MDITLRQFWAESGYDRDDKSYRLYGKVANAIVKRLKPLWSHFGLSRPRVGFSFLQHPCVAIYIAETQDKPIILLDCYAHALVAPSKTELLASFRVSIAHELVHACLDYLGLECEEHFEHEDEIERIARDLCLFNNYPEAINSIIALLSNEAASCFLKDVDIKQAA